MAEKKDHLEAMTRQHQQHVKLIEVVKKVRTTPTRAGAIYCR